MSKFINWGEAKSSANSIFLKWGDKTRIRVLTPPMPYMKEWPTGIKQIYVGAVIDIDTGEVKIADFKMAMLETFAAYAEEGIAPDAPDAHGFTISKTGSGKNTKYSCLPSSKPFPIPSTVDVAAARKMVTDFVAQQIVKTEQDQKSPPAQDQKRPPAQVEHMNLDDAA